MAEEALVSYSNFNSQLIVNTSELFSWILLDFQQVTVGILVDFSIRKPAPDVTVQQIQCRITLITKELQHTRLLSF